MARNKPAISFSGCGFNTHFYGGVAEYLIDNFETDDIDILCTSGGVYSGTILALNRKMTEWTLRDYMACHGYYTNRPYGLLLDTTDYQKSLWRGYLPDNAYKLCSDRLHITISCLGLYGFYEKRISTYESNEALIDAMVGTIHIPGIFRQLPIVCGKYAFDGCYTNLMPRTHSKTLLVKLFGRGHIDYGNRLSLTKMLTIASPHDYIRMILEGYEIASRRHQEFINCGFRPLKI
jgi:hypothetical protein